MDKKKLGRVVAGVFAVMLCGIIFLCNNYQKSDVIVTEGFSDSKAAGDGSPRAEAEEKTGAQIYIHICGEVKKPGVYVFEKEPRVVEVVDKAGGFTKNADRSGVNLAESVTDGVQLVIGAKGNKNTNIKTEAGAESEKAPGKVNINQASKEELMTLSGIGESKASQIISYRESHGAFRKTEDIMNISGIKNGVFDKIKDFITV